MRCPFRKIVNHYAEREEAYVTVRAKDVEEFAECYREECPYYRSFFGQEERCGRVGDDV